MGFEEARKRRTYGHCTRPEIYKSARADFHPLKCFSSVHAVVLLGNGRSEYSKIPLRGRTARTVAHPLGRIDFPGFALFLVLDLVFWRTKSFVFWGATHWPRQWALPLGTPQAISTARAHKGNRSALLSIWSLGPVSCNNTKTTQNQGLYHEVQANNVS